MTAPLGRGCHRYDVGLWPNSSVRRPGREWSVPAEAAQPATVLPRQLIAPLTIRVIDGHRCERDRGDFTGLRLRELFQGTDSMQDPLDGGPARDLTSLAQIHYDATVHRIRRVVLSAWFQFAFLERLPAPAGCQQRAFCLFRGCILVEEVAITANELVQRPHLRAIVRRLVVSLLFANVIPGLLFYLCFVVGNVWLALSVALAWCYGAMLWRLFTKRRSSGLLWLTVIGLTARTALAAGTGSTFLYFIQPAVGDTLTALVFLISLATATPVVARVAADFYPMTAEVSQRPRIKRLFWNLTLLWAGICLVRAGVTMWLLHALTLPTYVTVRTMVNPSIALTGAALTLALAVRVARRESLLHAGIRIA
jgi:hypothetical protein